LIGAIFRSGGRFPPGFALLAVAIDGMQAFAK